VGWGGRVGGCVWIGLFVRGYLRHGHHNQVRAFFWMNGISALGAVAAWTTQFSHCFRRFRGANDGSCFREGRGRRAIADFGGVFLWTRYAWAAQKRDAAPDCASRSVRHESHQLGHGPRSFFFFSRSPRRRMVHAAFWLEALQGSRCRLVSLYRSGCRAAAALDEQSPSKK